MHTGNEVRGEVIGIKHSFFIYVYDGEELLKNSYEDDGAWKG
jgi:hypothetical protein